MSLAYPFPLVPHPVNQPIILSWNVAGWPKVPHDSDCVHHLRSHKILLLQEIFCSLLGLKGIIQVSSQPPERLLEDAISGFLAILLKSYLCFELLWTNNNLCKLQAVKLKTATGNLVIVNVYLPQLLPRTLEYNNGMSWIKFSRILHKSGLILECTDGSKFLIFSPSMGTN